MADYQLELIEQPKAGTASVLDMQAKGPTIAGQGPDNYKCGACGEIICKEVNRGQVVSIVFRCGYCRAYNRARGT